jgi:hypothetical protein
MDDLERRFSRVSLFTDADREQALRRLEEYGWRSPHK